MEIRFEGVGGSDFEIESPQDRALKQFFVRAFQFLAMPRPKKSDAEKAARGTLQKCRMNGRTIPVAKDRLSEEPPVGVPGDAKEAWARSWGLSISKSDPPTPSNRISKAAVFLSSLP